MSGDDDFYYRRKPHRAIVRYQGLSPAGRGALVTYEDHMHTRDGTVPDERTARGLAWHMTAQGVRERRTVLRLVAELLEAGVLQRLADGQLTSPEVAKEFAHRARKPKAKPDGAGGGGDSGQGSLPFRVIPGGRSPQTPVEEAVDEPGTDGEMAGSRPRDDHLETNSGRKTQQNQRQASLKYRERENHEVVAVWTRFRARARGDPPSARA